jgi:outer membrane protein assembly factor BamA
VKLSYGHSSAGSRDIQVNVHAPSVSPNKLNVDINARLYEDNSSMHFSSFSKNVGSLALHVSSIDSRHKLSMACAVRDEIPSSAPRIDVQKKQWAHDREEKSKMFTNDLLSSFPANVRPSFGKTAAQDVPMSVGPLEFPIHSSRHASPGMLHSLAPSTKTNVEYTYTACDSRDHPANPSRGQLLRGTVEVALPPGTARFAKVEVTAEKHLSLAEILPFPALRHVTASFCGSFGTARLLGGVGEAMAMADMRRRDYASDGQRRQLNLSDRFFLGGPGSLRGLHLHGVGPRSSLPPSSDTSSANQGVDDALGGMSRVVGMAVLAAPVPFSFASSENMRSFLFLNAGTLLPHSLWPLTPLSTVPAPTSLGDMFTSFRLSVGCGLSYALGPARLELTYALPLRIAQHDVVKPFQIGIGLSMNN